ncbi:carbohydrate ABC transporter permease [Streptomyces sp. MP131-18]|uniref:carbohydrate ABC transporter permease n=1 Tax=Streptomyces sp. MP131-18 TaxID=1857892 RepID=UPI0009CDD6AB|nr:carbohydrate ABC transporter permease [Streptomyces sp. MP131-18]ONK15394.1 L-arabinose transport system permease protein AraQ [Streptomyces sp. MP131-18]
MSSAVIDRVLGTAEERPAWQERPRLATRIGKVVALLGVCTLIVVPLLVVVSTSLASPDEVTEGGGWVLWPTEPTLQTYQDILSGGTITRSLVISVGITVGGTLISLFGTITLAYALSRDHFSLRRPLLLMVLFTFLFPPSMLPSYLVVKNLGLLDTYWALTLPVAINVFNLVIMRGFFQALPGELYDAARIDGAGELTVLTRIVLPLSKPVIAVIGLFYAVGYWNSFFHAILYLNDSSDWPLQAVLQTVVTQGAALGGNTSDALSDTGALAAPQSYQMATVVVAIVPILVIYPFIQKYFTKGVLTGAIKS